jgi:hypothetical protein
LVPESGEIHSRGITFLCQDVPCKWAKFREKPTPAGKVWQISGPEYLQIHGAERFFPKTACREATPQFSRFSGEMPVRREQLRRSHKAHILKFISDLFLTADDL